MAKNSVYLYSLLPSAVLLAVLSGVGGLRQAAVVSGSLIKGSSPAVYYVGADEQRYVFPDSKTYFTWYSGFSGVTTVSDEELAGYRIGGNVTYRPGTRLVKIQSDPKVYAVAKGGILRWVKTETAAKAIFGDDWSGKVNDISDSFFVNYTIGPDIASAADFDPSAEAAASQNISEDKSLGQIIPPTEGGSGSQETASCSNSSCSLGSACIANACKAVPGPSPVKLETVLVDYADVCFVGDPCEGGACCMVNGLAFADNASLKTVFPRDAYLYAGKQQLCGRASVSSVDRSRFTQAMSLLSDDIAASTENRVLLGVSQTRISGEITMSRVPGSCDWWISPDDLRARFATTFDKTMDAMFVFGSRTFDFGAVSAPDAVSTDQESGIRGAGYTFVAKEWDNNPTQLPDISVYRSSLKSQLDAAVDLGISDPESPYVGNHCRDGKQDFDEIGVDCGGSGCYPCL